MFHVNEANEISSLIFFKKKKKKKKTNVQDCHLLQSGFGAFSLKQNVASDQGLQCLQTGFSIKNRRKAIK